MTSREPFTSFKSPQRFRTRIFQPLAARPYPSGLGNVRAHSTGKKKNARPLHPLRRTSAFEITTSWNPLQVLKAGSVDGLYYRTMRKVNWYVVEKQDILHVIESRRTWMSAFASRHMVLASAWWILLVLIAARTWRDTAVTRLLPLSSIMRRETGFPAKASPWL